MVEFVSRPSCHLNAVLDIIVASRHRFTATHLACSKSQILVIMRPEQREVGYPATLPVSVSELLRAVALLCERATPALRR